jgi:hypothetical protein
MKRLVLAAVFCSGQAFAAEWVPLPHAGSTDQYFYDSSKLVIKDDEITYWKKILFKTPQPVKGESATSRLMRERMNCGEHSVQVLSYLYYSADGEAMDYVAQMDAAALAVIPDTAEDAFDRVLCPLVWRNQEEMRIKAEQGRDEAELKQAPEKLPAAPTQPIPENPAQPPAPLPQIMDQLY